MNRLLMMVKGLSVLALVTATMVTMAGCTNGTDESEPSESAESDISSDSPVSGYQKDAWGGVIEKANGGVSCPTCGPVPDPWKEHYGPVPDPWRTHSAGTGSNKDSNSNNGK